MGEWGEGEESWYALVRNTLRGCVYIKIMMWFVVVVLSTRKIV